MSVHQAGFFESAIASLKTELELAANETAHGANESIANINLNEIAGGAQEFLENYNFFGDAETTGYSSHRRDCYLTGTPCLSLLRHPLKVQGGAIK